MNYRIVRFYKNHPEGVNRVILKDNVTQEEAIEHCLDSETSSATCKKPDNLFHKEVFGEWFDGWEEYR